MKINSHFLQVQLIKFDRFLDRSPFSFINNAFNLILKSAFAALPPFQQKNRYFIHVKKKSLPCCLALLFPPIGQKIVAKRQKDGETAFQEGEKLYKEGKWEKADQVFAKAAQLGYAPAWRLRGEIYALYRTKENSSSTQAVQKILSYYQRAAEQGDAEAMHTLSNDLFGEEEREKGLFWLKESAASDYAPAMHALAQYYGKRYDIKRALYWVEKSAEKNYEPALTDLKEMRARKLDNLAKV